MLDGQSPRCLQPSSPSRWVAAPGFADSGLELARKPRSEAWSHPSREAPLFRPAAPPSPGAAPVPARSSPPLPGLRTFGRFTALPRATPSKPRPLRRQAPPLRVHAPASSLRGSGAAPGPPPPAREPWSGAASPPANMALRAARSVRAAACSLRAASASAAPCPPRPWGLRTGTFRTLRTGASLLSGERGGHVGERAASGWRRAGPLPPRLGPYLRSPPRLSRGTPGPPEHLSFIAGISSCVAPLPSLSGVRDTAAFVPRLGTRAGGLESARSRCPGRERPPLAAGESGQCR